jgi:hypothetical protein
VAMVGVKHGILWTLGWYTSPSQGIPRPSQRSMAKFWLLSPWRQHYTTKVQKCTWIFM